MTDLLFGVILGYRRLSVKSLLVSMAGLVFAVHCLSSEECLSIMSQSMPAVIFLFIAGQGWDRLSGSLLQPFHNFPAIIFDFLISALVLFFDF